MDTNRLVKTALGLAWWGTPLLGPTCWAVWPFHMSRGGTSHSCVCPWALTSGKQLHRALWSLCPSGSTVLPPGVPSWFGALRTPPPPKPVAWFRFTGHPLVLGGQGPCCWLSSTWTHWGHLPPTPPSGCRQPHLEASFQEEVPAASGSPGLPAPRPCMQIGKLLWTQHGEGYRAGHFLIPEGSDLLNAVRVCACTSPTPDCCTEAGKGHPTRRSAPGPA